VILARPWRVTNNPKEMIDKKELKKKYKETLPKMGVYKITNLVSGKIFVDRSMNLHAILNSHKAQLELKGHTIRELQNDFNSLGADKFAFDVLDYLEPKDDPEYDYTRDLKALEEMWLENLKASGVNSYYK